MVDDPTEMYGDNRNATDWAVEKMMGATAINSVGAGRLPCPPGRGHGRAKQRRRRPQCALLAVGRVGRAPVAARKLVFHSIEQTHMNIARHDRHTSLFHHDQVASTAAAA